MSEPKAEVIENWREYAVPPEVRARMRALLAAALAKAATMEPPGDGNMFTLDLDVTIGDGMWDGGWKLQADLLHDERWHPWPYVTVHAYQGDTITRGSLTGRVIYDAAARLALAERGLSRMVAERAELDREIEELRAKIESGEV